MENTFAEELIYSYNPKLKSGDLEKLNKISVYYDIYDCIDIVFKEDFCTIVNHLVINELPYAIASRLLFKDKLINNFLEYKDNRFFMIGELFGSMCIYRHVDRINHILNES